ncbi:MAG: MFS transporter [Desulfofustis sp.]|nr:MFS transporter [Desulfofustis sp.]
MHPEGRPEENRALERSALIVATLTSFMGPFMMSSVNVALPQIQAELQMNAVQLSWIATAYLLAVAVGLIPAGKVADIQGRKKIFAMGLAVYTAGSFIAAFVDSAVMLIMFRVIQGLGASMFVTTGMAILTSIFPPNRRGRAIGLYASAVYVGLSTGPFLGGLMTHYLGWRSIFMLMLPFGLFSLIITFHFLKGEWRGEPDQKLDIGGCLLYGISILALVYGATRLPEKLGVTLVSAGAVLLVIFFRYQLKARFPVFDVTLFTVNKPFTFSSMAALLNYATTFSVTFLMSLYLQYIKGLEPQTAGMVLMVQPVMMAILSPITGKLADRIEPRLLATTGMTFTVIGILLFSQINQGTSLYLIIANLFFMGTGFALFSSPNMIAIMGTVQPRYYGLASGTVSTMRLLGQMASMAIATVVLALIVGREVITPDRYDLFLRSTRIVFTISAVLCSTGIYFSWFRGSVLQSDSTPPNRQ